VRPRVERHDFSKLLLRLNQIEGENEGVWRADNSELASAFKFLSNDGTLAASTLAPDEVAKAIRAEMISGEASFAAG
jgi:hypothetical protein